MLEGIYLSTDEEGRIEFTVIQLKLLESATAHYEPNG